MDRSATPAPPDGRTVDPGNRRAHMRRQIAAHYGRVNDPNPDDGLTDEPTDNTGIGSDNNDTPSSLDPAEPWTLSAYRFATRFAGSFARASLNRRLDAGKEDASRLHERLGAPLTQRPAGNLIWIHGASVGEALSVLPLVARLGNLRPDLHFLVTTGTTTSASLMADRLPAQAFHQFS
ncbi:MAG: glycosyltransferase N-terminal domain-containing protein, partial [Pseudomonadota bacterium]